jgi:hypothetical protein
MVAPYLELPMPFMKIACPRGKFLALRVAEFVGPRELHVQLEEEVVLKDFEGKRKVERTCTTRPH